MNNFLNFGWSNVDAFTFVHKSTLCQIVINYRKLKQVSLNLENKTFSKEPVKLHKQKT
jgi:hypothetical protein